MAGSSSLTPLQLGFVLLYFIYGLAFFTMGIALLLESGRTPGVIERRLIRPLAVFGLIHGVHEWMEIFLLQGIWLGLAVPDGMQILRVGLLALSFIPLVAFGVLNLFPQAAFPRFAFLGTVLVMFILAAIWASAQAGVNNPIGRIDALTRYLLAVPGGILAGIAMIARARHVGQEKRTALGGYFRWAAVGFEVYGLTQLLAPPADIFPALSLNSAWFFETTGVPIQLIRAAAAVVITGNLLRAIQYVEGERERQLLEAQRARLEALEHIKRELELREAMREELLRHTVIAQEEERSRIARELHDETTQVLTGFSLDLATLSRILPRRSEAHQLLSRLQTLCRQMSQDLYRLINDLRPGQLDNLGLVAALQHLAEAERTRVGQVVSLEIRGVRQRMDPLVEMVIYRVAQEALSNASRHALVDRARICLAFEPHEVRLQVSDPGVGFDPSLALSPPRGWGLAGMRERVESVGGVLSIQSAPGKGTEIQATIPVEYILHAFAREDIHD